MNAQCRTARVCSSSTPSEWIGDPISNNGFEFSINFLHLVRQSALFNSTSSSQALSVHLHTLLQPLQVSPLPSRNFHRESYTHPPIPFQCQLSCWYCCSQLEALLDAPCASSILPVVPRSHRSLRSPVPTPFCKWRWFKWRWRWRRR